MIGNAFHRSSKLFGSRTFIECRDNTTTTTNTTNNKAISYKDAFTIAKQHEEWIRHTIQEHRVDCCSCGHDVEVVVAYLSHNSPDLILSLLGCMDVMNANTNINERGRRGSSTIHVRLAMLNARWSAKEIAQALRVHEHDHRDRDVDVDDHDNTKKGSYHRLEHMTIIIYGDTLGPVAKEAASLLMNANANSNSNGGTGQRNGTFALPLPSLVGELIIPKVHVMQEYAGATVPSSSSSSSSYNDEAVILFTSGTTSGPKGVKLSHLGLFIQSMAKLHEPCCYDENTKMLATTVPFFHVGGLSSALAVLIAGGCLVFPPIKPKPNVANAATGNGNGKGGNFSFDPEMVVESIADKFDSGERTNSVDTLVIVPAMLHAILAEIKRRSKGEHLNTFQGVRLLLLGGQSLTQPQLMQSKEIFPNARIVQTYACTEASSSLTFADIYNPLQKSKSKSNGSREKNSTAIQDDDNDGIDESKGSYVGTAPPHIELSIFALKNHRPTFKKVPPYTIGAIGTRGPHVMKGYWRRGGGDDDDNGKGLINQWLITNDLGLMDNKGRLYFCGRLNDVIRTGGETVFAPEVESTLIRHPSIDQCAVFSLPDERFGECVCAAIVLNDDAKDFIFNEQEQGKSILLPYIRDFCKQQNLTSFKRPRRAFILDALPRNSSGKVLKHELERRLSIHSRL